MRNILLLTLILLFGALSGAFGYSLAQDNMVPQIVTKVVYKTHIVQVDRPIIMTVIQEVPIIRLEKVIEKVIIPTAFFKTEAKFHSYVAANHGLISIGSVSLSGSHDDANDCEDQADRWQGVFEADGYKVYACPVHNDMVFDTQVGGGKYHVGLWTSIDNNYYYWDPVTGKITKLNVVRD